MKKQFIALFAALALVGCVSEEDIASLQQQINDLNASQIATINEQIASIQASIGQLESVDAELKGYIQTLDEQRANLESTDQILTQSILGLKTELYGAISDEKAAIYAQLAADKAELEQAIQNMTAQQSALEARMLDLESADQSLAEEDSYLQRQIDTLKSRISALEARDSELNTTISTLEVQLRSELTTAQNNLLTQLDAYKQIVASQIATINNSLAALTAKDEDLQTQLNNLRSYVNGEIQSCRTWASATFATLEQFNTTAGIISGIQAQITVINQQIQQLTDSPDAWLTQEDLDNAVADINDSISSLDASLQAKIQTAVNNSNSALSTARQEITAAYTAAIQSAISASETSIKAWVNQQLTGYYTIAETDAKIVALKTNLEGQLTAQKTYLEGLITSLEASLNSKISSNKSLISGLQSQINTVNSDLSSLAGTVAVNSSNIAHNSEQILANAHDITRHGISIDSCKTVIEANKALIAANDAAIKTNASAITALQSRATVDESQITANASAIAKNAQDIAKNASLISANATAISNNAAAISNNAADIAQLRTDLTTTRTEITAAYNEAIASSIETLSGQLTGQIASEVSTINTRITNEIAAVNSSITALTTRVTACEKDIKNIKNTIYAMQQDIENLQDQVTAILSRIQSITYVPKYSDGKAIMTFTNNGTITPGTAVFDFELKPTSTAAELAQVWQTALTMKAVYTVTKAAPETVELPIVSASADNGFLTITVSGSSLSNAYFKSQCSANVRLSVSDGNNDVTTDYIQMVPWTTDVISIPDANFKAYCVENFDTSGDGELSEDEAQVVTSISASMLNIASLAGIEYFTALESIDVSFNKLTTLDLSNCTALTSVDVSGNKLQNLNISGLANLITLDAPNNKLGTINVSESASLQSLDVSNNQLGSLNLKNNKALTELNCNSNNIQVLDLKNNTALTKLYLRKNDISVLDVTKFAALQELDCSQNNLTSINLYQNSNLEILYCGSNQLTSLGISSNTKLTYLDCRSNALTSLDLSKNTLLETVICSDNQLVRLDVSANTVLETVVCTGNPSLSKLWVKDSAQADALDVTKDNLTTIAFNNGGISIPDANLKAYLLALFDDDEDGEISVLEAENVQNVNCSGRSISDLTGLEVCPNLKYLNFNGNNVSIIDLPNLQKLETIVAYDNPIERINVNNDTALTALYLQDVNTNALSGTTMTIDGYDQAATLYLAFAGTKFTTLKLTNSGTLTSYNIAENVQLTKLVANGNSKVTGVDLASLTALNYLKLNNCGLTALNVDTNIDLDSLYCYNNSLSTLNVDNNTKLISLSCHDNNISTLKVTNNTALVHLNCSANQLVNINVRNNTALKTLNVASNAGITALALGYNTVLETLNASNTGLADIDMSANIALKNLTIHSTSITILDLSRNVNLACLDISNTAISTLNLSTNTKLEELNLISTSISSINLSNNKTIVRLDYTEGIEITSGFSVGHYIMVNGVAGVAFYVSGTTTKIISLDESYQIWSTSTSLFGTNTTDGFDNTQKILQTSPAAKWCVAHGTRWYLPALDEFQSISEVYKTLNTTLSSRGGTILTVSTGNQTLDHLYWSSSEIATYKEYPTYGYPWAYAYYIYSKSTAGSTTRSSSYRVRAIRQL